jgi:hypothetical protein
MVELDLNTFNSYQSVGLCLYDAGAANQIIALLKRNEPKEMYVYAEGPARKLWEQAFGPKCFCQNIHETIDQADLVLAGTGWASDIERRGIFEAKKQGKICLAYFDHWTNYDQRLSWSGVELKPDAIWVADAEAKRIADHFYPDIPVFQVPNFYIAQKVNKIEAITHLNNAALYLCEPILTDGVSCKDLTLEPVLFALNQIEKGHLGPISTCILRLHPSQTPEELLSVIEQSYNFTVEISSSVFLEKDISRSSVVIGYNTYALVVASVAGRKVFCSAPPGWVNSQLSLPSLKYLRDFSQ